MSRFLDTHHVVNGAYPKADAFASTLTTDYVSVQNYRKVTFLIHTGVATGGTADGVITVLAATDNAAAGATPIPFKYSVCLSSTTVDAWAASADAAAAGFVMTAASNVLYVVEVNAEDVAAGLTAADFVACLVTEDTDDPVVAGIITVLGEPRYPQEVPRTAIA